MTKFSVSFSVLGLSLLLGACGQQAAPSAVAPVGELPTIPIALRPDKPECKAAVNAVAKAGGITKFSFVNFMAPDPSLGALYLEKSAPTVENELIAVRALINVGYYGFSTVDRQRLHQQYETEFRKSRPGSLANYGLDAGTDALMERYLDGMQDSHTYFMDSASYQAYTDVRNGNQQSAPNFGFGFRPLPNGDGAVVVSVRGDGPAFAAGLQRGDLITAIDGMVLKRTVFNDPTDNAQAQLYIGIRATGAAKKTPVSISFKRAGVAQSVNLTGVLLNSANLPWGKLSTAPSGAKQFYLNLPTFAPDGVGQKVHDLVAQAQTAGAQGMIVDLRNDGGGQLDETYAAAGAFAPDTTGNVLEDLTADDQTARYSNGNLIVSTTCTKDKAPQSIKLVSNPQMWSGKVAVLVNGNSASGSEYFAQALRLGGKAAIIGETTAGDGNTFINIIPIPGARGMGLTIGRARGLDGKYYPAAQTPSVAAPDDLIKLAAGTDLALNAAYTFLDK